MDFVSSQSIDVAEKALDGLAQRHVSITSNLANVDTPNYRRKQVRFEDTLQQALASYKPVYKSVYGNTDELPMLAISPAHYQAQQEIPLESVQPEIIEDSGMQYRNDGNSVDVEHEMADMARNTERYLALSNMQSRMIRSLKATITNSQ